MNFRNLVLLCLVLLTAIAYSTTYTYEVKYMDTAIVDGNSDGWTAEKQYLNSVPTGDQSEDYIMLSYRITDLNTKSQKNMLCGFFWISDTVNNAALDYVSLYNLAANSEHPKLKFGRNTRIYDIADNAITNSDEFQYKKVESAGGWQGEFCIPFSYAGFSTTSETIKNIIIRYENNNVAKSVWPFGPTNSWNLHSVDKWGIPTDIGCTSNSQCKDTETCADNSCKPVHEGTCGYVAQHQWNTYECCANADCSVGTSCVNHVCKSPNQCIVDSSCADNEYCATAAAGNKCLPVIEETCGYVKNHKWNKYDCCTNDDCAPNNYCSEKTCFEVVPTTKCGEIINHTWQSYQCCSDSGCNKGSNCISHKCVVNKTYCSGKVGLNVFYYDKLNNLMAAEITGLNNCDGNVAFIRKDSCTGAAACAFNIGIDGNYCTFAIPNKPGIYKYMACVDVNGDVSYGPGETAETVITVEPGECQSVGCKPQTWGSCVCEGTSTKGYKLGRCVDNCLNQNMYKTECSCGTETITPIEEIKTLEEQVTVTKPKTVEQPAPAIPIEYWQIAAVICILAIPILLHLLGKEKK